MTHKKQEKLKGGKMPNGVSVIPYINNSSSALLAKPLEGGLKAA